MVSDSICFDCRNSLSAAVGTIFSVNGTIGFSMLHAIQALELTLILNLVKHNISFHECVD